jgi:hypothetical protein
MPYKSGILFILYTTQEWDKRIISLGSVSDWLRPFHRQIYSSTDGSQQIIEPRLKSITQTNHRLHALHKVYMLFILYTSQEWDQSITSICPISDWFRSFQRQIYSSTDQYR